MNTTERLELLSVLDYVLSNPSKSRASTKKKKQMKASCPQTPFEDTKNRLKQAETNEISQNYPPEMQKFRNEDWIEGEESRNSLAEILSGINKGRKMSEKSERVQRPRALKVQPLNRADSNGSTCKSISTSICSDSEGTFLSPVVSAELTSAKLKSSKSFMQVDSIQEILMDEGSEEFIDGYRWTSSSDETLLELAYEFNCDWQRIARSFPDQSVSPKLLKDRYRTLNDITLPNKARFAPQEDRKVLRYYEKFGTNWNAIASMLPGRGAVTIKNRFYSSLRYKIKKGSEDDSSVESPVQEKATASSGSMNLEEIETKAEQDDKEKGSTYSWLEMSGTGDENKQHNDCDHFFSFYDNREEEFNGGGISRGMTFDFQNQNQILSNQQDGIPHQNQLKMFERNFSNGFLNLGENHYNMPGEFENEKVEFGEQGSVTVDGLNKKINSLMSLYHEICQDLSSTRHQVNDKENKVC
jgi:hypothetical protein